MISGKSKKSVMDEHSESDSLASDSRNRGPGSGLQAERDHYPMCILWTPLPVLTWFLPFVGHLGISTSKGEIHDFAGPYYVNVRPLRFSSSPLLIGQSLLLTSDP